ncbi:hypothetical protein GLOIN_2v1736512 [Rhizophagus clarus]|uniref:Uncharacterized protein n=1 Tax=Rhizophagus clarus TaxID=94130 RepID=A0A8H3QGM5_9GLOM|nr:hypothetical protein GLOIN_2v1736512 [Rhizophagus clarus]
MKTAVKKLSRTSENSKILYETFLEPHSTPTKNKMSGQESEIFDNEHRLSDDSSCHYMKCFCPLLYDQHWQTSEFFDSFRPADGMVVSTFKPVGEVDIDFRANTRDPGTQGQTMANSNKCVMEIKAPEKTKALENHDDLVRSIDNRGQEYQKTNNKFTTTSRFREPSSLSSGCEWEIEKESKALEVRKLCLNEHIFPTVIKGTRVTNPNSCNRNTDTKNETTLLELRNDHGTQHTRDLLLLLELLKNKEPYHDETNKNVFNDVEIRLFAGLYGITNFRPVLAYDSMIRGGDSLKEALSNYLFNQENLRYVDEITRELIPLNAYDKEVEEWAKSRETHAIDVTKSRLYCMICFIEFAFAIKKG